MKFRQLLEQKKYTLMYLSKVNLHDLSYEELLDIVNYFRNKPKEYIASKKYKKIFPYVNNAYKILKLKLKEQGEKVMKQMGVWYGDDVRYDYMDMFMGITPYYGTIIKSQGKPKVKISKGKTINNRKNVSWHKGWIKDTHT